jgi:hypothetical protein
MTDTASQLNKGAVDRPPNRLNIDGRMSQIKEILGHAATPLLQKCALISEWVHLAEVIVSVSGHSDRNAKVGRPEGGIARAARDLPVPGKTAEGRRKYIERALKIDGVWPEAKAAARAAGIDNTQSALLAIASGNSREAQIAKINEIVVRKEAPRRKSCGRDGDERVASVANQSGSSGANLHSLDAIAVVLEPAAQWGEKLAVEPEALKAQASNQSVVAGKPDIDPLTVNKSGIDHSKPASIAALIEFAKFVLARIREGQEIALTVTATDEVKEFRRLANRVRLALRQEC